MFNLRNHKKTPQKGQNITEYAILIVLVIGAFIATSTYVKRGIQGRWKEAVDELGEQYDPTVMVTDINYITNVETNTSITATDVGGGVVTMRNDVSTTSEQKTGNSTVGAY